jgi:hypothetical protein
LTRGVKPLDASGALPWPIASPLDADTVRSPSLAMVKDRNLALGEQPRARGVRGVAGAPGLAGAIVVGSLSPVGAHGRADGPLWLLKGDPDRARLPGTIGTPGSRRGRRRIRCPRCSWEPARHDRWMCICLHIWNTFETRGVCPECGRRWANTQCLSCTQWSPHEDWYDDEPESSA